MTKSFDGILHEKKALLAPRHCRATVRKHQMCANVNCTQASITTASTTALTVAMTTAISPDITHIISSAAAVALLGVGGVSTYNDPICICKQKPHQLADVNMKAPATLQRRSAALACVRAHGRHRPAQNMHLC